MGQGLCGRLWGLPGALIFGFVPPHEKTGAAAEPQRSRASWVRLSRVSFAAWRSSSRSAAAAPAGTAAAVAAAIAPPDVEQPGRAPHPLDTARWASRVSVCWLSGLVTLANRRYFNQDLAVTYQRQLREDDVWDLPSSLDPQVGSFAFSSAWATNVARAKITGRRPSIARAIFHAFWWDFLLSAITLFLFACSNLAQPFFIRGILRYLQEGNAPGSSPGSVGMVYAMAMLGFSALSSFLLSNYFRIAYGHGIKVKGAITSVVFKHSLELSAAARAVGSLGQTTNLMAVDAEKLSPAVVFFHFVWMAPLAGVFVGVLLTVTVGLSALAGLALIALMWPVQLLLAKHGGRARRRAMAFTDERVKFMTEVVCGIRAVKLCSWEEAVFDRVSETRRLEVKWLSASHFLKALTRECILMLLPPAALAVIFALERARGVLVDETLAWMALGFLNTLRFPFNLFAAAAAAFQDGLVSCGRLREFLLRPTLPQQRAFSAEAASVDITEACFEWGFAVQGPSFQLQVPALRLAGPGSAAILGRVGSGKSSLLAALLGEMQRMQGKCALRGRVAFMGQTPWIQNLSVRENILFGRHFDEGLYCRALDAAALAPDLEVLQDGDLTEIGERGINLSGGQKARVGLARCLYAVALGDCDALILDCPFDALDVPTGRHVFKGIAEIAGAALLVCAMSAQVHLLPRFSRIVVIEDGRVTLEGDYAAVASAHPELVDVGEPAKQGATFAPPTAKGGNLKAARAVISQTQPKKGVSRLTREDRSGTGSIGLSMVLSHLGEAASGGVMNGVIVGSVVLMLFLCSQAARVASDILVTSWGSGGTAPAVAFGVLGLCAKLLWSRVGASCVASHRASTGLHARALRRLLRAPVTEYFDVTTTGEIINKLSKDLDTTDSNLPETCTQYLSNATQLLTIFVLSSVAFPPFAVILGILGYLFLYIGRKFSAASRDLKRLDGSSRSPVYNSFSETLAGLETIRAWRAEGQFLEKFQQRHRHNLSFSHAVAMSEAWVMARLESISFTIIGAFAFLAVLNRGLIQRQLAGLALVYSIQLTAMLQRTVQLTILVGQQFTSCERVRSLAEVPQEPEPVEEKDTELPEDWPSGGIAFEGVKLRYRDGDLVLKGVSFEALPGERVGVCGRTGAGKSTLLAALFRLAEPCGGVVRLAGVDTSLVGVRTLRSRLSIIPQEPVIFSGSVRSNLDPFGVVASDEELLDVMRRVGLGELARDLGLNCAVAERGENLSQGQRQLLCIARAMLRRSRVTALDEATSAMDAETDRAVQQALAEHWRAAAGDGGTMLTIAHRLSTILDYDRILVLSFGEVAEFGKPSELLARRRGALARMLREEPSAS